MTDLVTVIRSIRADLTLVKTTLQCHIPPPSRRRSVKSGKQTRPHKETQPPWVEAISLRLSRMSLAIESVERELQKGSTIGDSHGHNVNSDKQNAAQDARSPTLEQHSFQQTSTPPQIPLDNGSSLTVSDTETREQRADALLLPSINCSTQRLSEPDAASQTPPSGTASSLGSHQTGPAETRHEAVVHTTPSPLVSGESLSTPGQVELTLSVNDMGQELVPNIMRLANDDRFPGILSVQGMEEIDWTHLARSIQQPKKDHELLGVKYSKSHTIEGVAQLKLSASKKFTFPDFSQTIEEPSREACLDYLRQVIDNPPEATIPYYVGPPLATTFDHLLHPGEALLGIPPIEGLNRVYWYAGEKGSGTPCHCEDWKLYSYNLVLYGWKLWILIRLSHNEKFEDFIRKHWPSNNCDQFVRHHTLLISPETLEKNGIEFDIVVAGPGKLVVTKPEQYHMVLNITQCKAVAINFAPPGRSFLPHELCVCPNCGLYPLKYEGIRRVPCKPTLSAKAQSPKKLQGNEDVSQLPEKRQRREDHTQSLKRRRIGEDASQSQTPAKSLKMTKASKGLKVMAEQIRKIDKLCHLPPMRGKPSTAVFKLVAAIGSRAAVQQFFTLVAEVRTLGNTIRLDATGDAFSRAVQRAQHIKTSERKSTLAKFLKRVNQVFLVRDLDKLKAGRQRSDTTVLRMIEKENEWSKSTLEQHRKMGNKWNRICGDYEGLLCFIFLDSENPFNISPEDYESMTGEDLEVFHRLLKDDYFESIRSAGEAFQRSLASTEVDIEFRWEGRKAHLDRLSEKELLSCLEPFPTAPENLYYKPKFSNQPKPSAWPKGWPWPCNPTWVPPDTQQCDLCPETSCDCVKTKIAPKFKPRIKDFGAKGRGLQAVARTPGCYAYKQGEILGELNGVLEPLGRYRSNPWTSDMVREDLEYLDDLGDQDLRKKPVVCQISCAEISNPFRLANSGCKPSTTLVGMRISGKYRWVFKATRHILHGEEITANFGKRSLKGKSCLCIDCVHKQLDDVSARER